MKVAVIDIGTNSTHVVLAEIRPNLTFEILGREKEMTRLGDGTFKGGRLKPEVMERGVTAIARFHDWAKAKGAQKIIPVATSAIREAKNGGEFIQKVLEQTGLKIQIITGDEEARLIYLGVMHSIEMKKGNTLVLDVGGGSVEIIVGNSKRPHFLKSFKMGVARIKDLYLQEEDEKSYERLEAAVKEALSGLDTKIKKMAPATFIGTSRTITTLANVISYRKESAPGRQPSFTQEELKNLYKELRNTTSEERLKIKGIDSGITDLIPGGAALVYVVMKVLGIDQITVCDKAIREGIFYDYIANNRHRLKTEEIIPDVRRRHVLQLARKCGYKKVHCEQVAKLALSIFDQTQELHGLTKKDRELLEYATLLHDIGYHVGFEKHHHHSYYLIRHAGLGGFTDEEIEWMAQIARYHRKSAPKKKHLEFESLSKIGKSTVRWLAGILRVADSLDRSHFSLVKNLQVKVAKDALRFTLKTSGDSAYELWAGDQSAAMLADVSGKSVEFEVR